MVTCWGGGAGSVSSASILSWKLQRLVTASPPPHWVSHRAQSPCPFQLRIFFLRAVTMAMSLLLGTAKHEQNSVQVCRTAVQRAESTFRACLLSTSFRKKKPASVDQLHMSRCLQQLMLRQIHLEAVAAGGCIPSLQLCRPLKLNCSTQLNEAGVHGWPACTQQCTPMARQVSSTLYEAG